MKPAALRRNLFCAGVALLVLTAAAVAAPTQRRAAAPAEYHERVQEALAAVEETAEFAAEDDSEAVAAALDFVREALPRSERVEAPGFTVEADNGWFHDALDEYERTAGARTAAERAAALEEIAARLRGLDARLAEAEGATGPARDKEAEKGRLNAILRRPEYTQREQQGHALERQLEQFFESLRGFFEWLRGLFPDFGPVQPGARGGLSRAAQIFIFGLSGLIIAYVSWRLWRRRERGAKSLSLGGARVVLGERLGPDETAADLLAAAERLAREGNLRAAIRKAYVALLCELGDRKVIGLAQHKTNRDYLQAVHRRAPRLYTEMLPLTSDFELHWYGAQPATESDWAAFLARCRNALKTSKTVVSRQ